MIPPPQYIMDRPDANSRAMSDDPNAVTRSIMPPAADDGATRTNLLIPDDLNVTRTIGAEARIIGQPSAPESLPNYEIECELGRGGMGVVYKARQAGLNREVALKMVLTGAQASATERMRFLAEAEAIAIVQHSGIIQVFEFGTHQGQPFFAMEFCPGGTLAAKLAGTPMPAREAAQLVAKIARAMQAAHAKGIVHRDLKPSNILFANDHEPKVTDFGLARVRESGSGLTQTGAILGSPSYMSPEQAEGKHELVGPISDVYSIGAILYECLTGRPPFRAATPLDTVMQVIKDEPVPPSKLAAKIPRDLETICLKTLSKDPGKRYATAQEFGDDLERFLGGEPIMARPPNIVEKYIKSFKRRPLVNILLLACGISVGAFFGLLYAANNRLRVKQELLELETKIANEARTEADNQALLAARRLDKSLEAVDRMMVRVAGEKWALKPELQQERRDVLEEAIAFYQSLGQEDSKNPAVRWQAARANLFAATSMISLGEYDRCREVATTSQTILKSLQADFPDDARYIRTEGEAISLLGHTNAIRAEFSSALAHYETALALAEKACQLDPTDDDNLTFKAECHSSIALFYSFQRPDLSRKNHNDVLKIAETLLTRPLPSYRARLLCMLANVNLATGDFETNPQVAKAKLSAAAEQSLVLDRMTPPNARSAEMYASAKAGMLIYRGVFTSRRGDDDAGRADIRQGVELIRRMLVVQPKSFPYRIQLIQFQSIHADILLRLKKLEESRTVLAEVAELKQRMVREQPQLSWVANLGNLQRTQQLIEDVRSEYRPDFESDADQLLTDTTPAVKYNIACVYAQAIAKAPAEKREAYAAKAVELLCELFQSGGYFHQSQNVRHLDTDSDLDPIRKRVDFQTFHKRTNDNLEEIEKKKRVEKPMPKPSS